VTRRKTAIITGAGRGIGKETAILLAKNGINVVVCSRTRKEIDSLAEEINMMDNQYRPYHHSDNIQHKELLTQKKPEALAIKCDVGVSSQVDSLIDSTLAKFGSVDILINNAGVVFVKKLMHTSEEEWDQTISSNLKSAFLCTKAVLPHMIDNRCGAIVNVSSGAGKVGFENISVYCASKFGMMGLTASLADEVANEKIRVMAICPGEVATTMQQGLDSRYYLLNKHKMLSPQDVADKIVEMIFDDKNYQNRESVDIDK
jgi:3-oxoacyl-[acyl-carrier protein] reductase